MTVEELKEILSQVQDTNAKIVVAKRKKRGGYTVYPQVVEAKECSIYPIGDSMAIVYED